MGFERQIIDFGTAVPSAVQIVPSYGGGANPWLNAWSFAPAVYRKVFTAALSSAGGGRSTPIPRCFELSGPADGTAAGVAASAALAIDDRSVAKDSAATTMRRWWARLTLRLRLCTHRQIDPWSRQSLDDGAFELMGARTLLQVRLYSLLAVCI